MTGLLSGVPLTSIVEPHVVAGDTVGAERDRPQRRAFRDRVVEASALDCERRHAALLVGQPPGRRILDD